ncbi:hypothetical protein H1P_30041 [Hyella patelloides LEGE 07179]|uniref:Uncharacterized protein n=1 Tax=Hyella patelloides LEGE 07179 TaxID=945734 RepID=A0A563VU86_9CYAN|nr:hypothetical protein H1P_30041 [Hyella patelloides LEGE 07179]
MAAEAESVFKLNPVNKLLANKKAEIFLLFIINFSTIIIDLN